MTNAQEEHYNWELVAAGGRGSVAEQESIDFILSNKREGMIYLKRVEKLMEDWELRTLPRKKHRKHSKVMDRIGHLSVGSRKYPLYEVRLDAGSFNIRLVGTSFFNEKPPVFVYGKFVIKKTGKLKVRDIKTAINRIKVHIIDHEL